MIQLGNVALAKKEQEKRRTILIVVKNLIWDKIVAGRTVCKMSDGRFVNLKSLYDDLQNFLYGTDFMGEPYLVSVEEVDYYVNIYRDISKTMNKELQRLLEEAL